MSADGLRCPALGGVFWVRAVQVPGRGGDARAPQPVPHQAPGPAAGMEHPAAEGGAGLGRQLLVGRRRRRGERSKGKRAREAGGGEATAVLLWSIGWEARQDKPWQRGGMKRQEGNGRKGKALRPPAVGHWVYELKYNIKRFL